MQGLASHKIRAVGLCATALAACAAEATFAPVARATNVDVYVDGGSSKGRCADSRTASKAKSASTPLCSLKRAVQVAPSGSTVLVQAGDYPALSVYQDTRRSTRVTIKPAAGALGRVRVDGIRTELASNLRFEGLRIPGLVNIQRNSHGIQVVQNDISQGGISLRKLTSGTLIEGNYIHDIQRVAGAAGPGNGYALWASEGTDRLTIRGNKILRVPVDGMLLGGPTNSVIENNEIGHVQKLFPGDHSDPIQIVGGMNVIIRSNYIHDTQHSVKTTNKPITNLLFEDNLIVRVRNYGVQLSGTNMQFTNNTVWNTDYGVTTQGSNVIHSGNVYDKLVGKTPAFEDYNLVASPAKGRKYGANTVLRQTPNFLAPDRQDYRLVNGLGVRSQFR